MFTLKRLPWLVSAVRLVLPSSLFSPHSHFDLCQHSGLYPSSRCDWIYPRIWAYFGAKKIEPSSDTILTAASCSSGQWVRWSIVLCLQPLITFCHVLGALLLTPMHQVCAIRLDKMGLRCTSKSTFPTSKPSLVVLQKLSSDEHRHYTHQIQSHQHLLHLLLLVPLIRGVQDWMGCQVAPPTSAPQLQIQDTL